MLELVKTGDNLRMALSRARSRGQSVGFVPTMGALHPGHVALIEEARRRADLAVVSIFVNPTQFGPKEDLGRYPRNLDGDLETCAAAGVGIVFAPEAAEMYPPGDATRVRVAGLSEQLCGPFRPGHFEGVATVVAKLFALMSPCVAVFGRKDYQQLRVVERMAEDLLFEVAIVGVPTTRDTDGLAMSSRNAYLSPDERTRGLSIAKALRAAWSAYARGERHAGAIRKLVTDEIAPRATSIDYVSLADPMTLSAVPDDAQLGGPTLLAVAARIGATRLIDNLVLGEDPPPQASGSG